MEKYFDAYAIGEERVTQGRTITESDVVFHAYHTGDFYPHHVDAEFAKATEFGQRVAHGTLVFSVGVGLTAVGAINEAAFSYGYDRLRFVRPVFIGDTLHVRVTIREKRDAPRHPDHGMVVEACDIRNQHGETVVYCEHLLLVRRRAPADPPGNGAARDADAPGDRRGGAPHGR
jgi:acyl dehydratase